MCVLNIGRKVGNFQFDYEIINHKNLNEFYTFISTTHSLVLSDIYALYLKVKYLAHLPDASYSIVKEDSV